MTKRTKVAVIGSGISGMSAAWALRHTHDVTLFEANDRFGGHSYTVDIQPGGDDVSVDVGFIVCNPLNYPNFMAFMDHLQVETIQSDMSFAVSDPEGFEWSSNPAGLFAQKRNLINPKFWSLISEILTFNRKAIEDVMAATIPSNISLGEYLDVIGMSDNFREQYILPMGAAIWSTPEADMQDYPAASFLQFFNNHRLLHRERPKWRTVKHGSQSYVKRLIQDLGDRAVSGARVEAVSRSTNGIEISVNGDILHFDEVVLAGHAFQSRELLGDGFEHQESVIAPIQSTHNRAFLHSDRSLMPKRKSAWAAWNVLRGEQGQNVTLSYWMNILQDLQTDKDIFVTLNPDEPPAADKTYGEFDFTHPLFNQIAAERVSDLKRINGRDGLWFAGAWMGHGFHEDGLKSGLEVAMSLGAQLPWEVVGVTPRDRSESGHARENVSAPESVIA
ncbi:MAG: NAD/FAD-binding protein [Ponticaulis sp.]|nr:NAD/FAD-binding protein [Ponticaulis sp.]|tara:strand:- start:40561 stop:41898 length:1338 start_codon:yes stop_codon:yes gene_type:complete